ncbi:MAG: L-threonylcarbamoyladenylate synthase, partial [Candidatus Thermoplasmatota archaeon]|nr:L-threonylcarbamoyladenylate synthase [Candidatus Thermoplasmatota archaeon]
MDEKIIAQAVQAVSKGNIIVYPTDTLYALGAGIREKRTILKIFSVKHRPVSMPLSLATSDIHQLEQLVVLSDLAKRLADRFFPGKITLICQRKPCIYDTITAGGSTVAVRIPDDPIALPLLKQTGPLIATSANIHGQPTPSTVSEIRK